jgi:hypothetical protein
MDLKKILEICGAITGFIPGVSSITAGIKAFIYYRRTKGNETDKALVEGTAAKVVPIANKKLNVDSEERECNESLWKASLVEAFPGINVIAAIYSSVILSRLFNVREVNNSPDNQKKYLFERYNIQTIENEQQSETLCNALKVIYNLEIQDIEFEKFFPSTKVLMRSDSIKKDLAAVLRGYICNPKTQSLAPVDLVKICTKEFIEQAERNLRKFEFDKHENDRLIGNSDIFVERNLLLTRVRLENELIGTKAYLKQLQKILASL